MPVIKRIEGREYCDLIESIKFNLFEILNFLLIEPLPGSFKASFVARYLLENNWRNGAFKLSRLDFPNASTFFSVRIAPDNEVSRINSGFF